MSISMVSLNVVSLMAMAPDREWSTPTLMVSAAWAVPNNRHPARNAKKLILAIRRNLISSPLLKIAWDHHYGIY